MKNSLFKKLTSMVLALLLIMAIAPTSLITTAAAEGEELLSNGSFEDGQTGWTPFTGGFSLVDDFGKTGTHSAKVTAEGVAIEMHESITVEPNTWYMLSASFHRDNDLQWLYVDMGDIPGEVQLRTTAVGEWETLSGQWYSGDRTSVDIRLVCEQNWSSGTSGTGNYYIDDISFTKSVYDLDNVSLENGSFENGMDSWDWFTGFQIAEGETTDGTHRLEWDGATSLALGQHAATAVKNNTWYEISADFYRSDPDRYLYIDMSDIAGEATVSAEGSGEWEHKSMLWYSGDTTAFNFRIVCEKNWATGADGTGDYYIDNIAIKESDTVPELLYNGSFEDGMASWNYIDGFDIVEADTTDGTHRLDWNRTSSLATGVHATTAVEKNTYYIISADFYRSDADRYIYVDMCDIAGEATVSASSSGKWESHSVLWYSGNSTAVNLRVVCEKNWATGKDGTGEYILDNITMYKRTTITAAEFLDDKTIAVTITPEEKKSVDNFKVSLGKEEVEIASAKQGDDGRMLLTLASPVIMGKMYTVSGMGRLEGSAKAKYVSADAITLTGAKFTDASHITLTNDKSAALSADDLKLKVSVDHGEYTALAADDWTISDNTIALTSPAAQGSVVVIEGENDVLGSVSAAYGTPSFPDVITHDWFGMNYTGSVELADDKALLTEAEDSYEFTFAGTGFTLCGPFGADYGIAEVLVDGILHGEANASSAADEELFTVSGLENGLHLVTVVKSRKSDKPFGFTKATTVKSNDALSNEYSVNGQWSILTDSPSSFSWSDVDGFDFDNAEPILVPGNVWEAFPGYNGLSWYGKVFNDYLMSGENERVYLRFEAVQYSCDVYLNGVKLGSNEGSEVPFEFDVTDVIKPNEDNFLSVCVSNGKGMIIASTNTQTGSFWDCGGIWQEVTLISRPEAFISDVYAQPDWQTGDVKIDITVNNETSEAKEISLSALINEKGGAQVESISAETFTAQPGENTFTINGKVENFKLWDTENPNLYTVAATLESELGRHDYEPFNIGFRHVEVKDGYYFLNGERYFLKMVHQNSYDPLIIQGTPRDMTYHIKALDNLKETGFNTFRTIGMAALPAQLDYCDEIGLMIYQESSQSWLGKNGWIDEVFDRLIIRDRNHPSLAIWGLLNEIQYYGDNRLDITRDYLTRLRGLDMTRIVMWNSGSFDYNPNCAHMSNSYSTTWDVCMGNETNADEVIENFYDGSLEDTTIDASENYVGDLHFYPTYPLQDDALTYLRTIGEGVNPVAITESGTGSMFNPYNERDKTIENGGDPNNFGMTHWVSPLIEGLDYIYAKYTGLSELYDNAEEIIEASDVVNRRQRQILMSYIRSNPQVAGYGLTSLSDAQGLGEGVMDNFREWKTGYGEMLTEAWAELRWCILFNNDNSNVRKGDKATFEVDIANEDVLPAGDYSAEFTIEDAAGTQVYSSGSVGFTVEAGETAPFAYKVWKGEVDITFPAGEYTLKAKLLDDAYTPASAEMSFYVTDNSDVVDEDSRSVTIAGKLPDSFMKALEENGVAVRKYDANARIDNEVILVAQGVDNTAEFWRSLYTKVAQGAYAAILDAELLGGSYEWFPGTEKPFTFPTAYLGGLYHNEWIAMKDDVLTDGLQTGLMDPSYYGQDLTKKYAYMMSMPEPDEVNMMSIYAQGLPLAGYAADGVGIGTYSHHNGSFTLSYVDIDGGCESPAVEKLLLNLINYGYDRAKAVTEIDKAAYEAELDSYGFEKAQFEGYSVINNDSELIEYDEASVPGDGGASYIHGDETLINGYARFTFEGTRFAVISAKNVDLGIAEVYIDGDYAGEINYFSSTIKYRQVVFTSAELSEGSHTVEIRHTGRKYSAATGTLTPLDAVYYLPLPPKPESVSIAGESSVVLGGSMQLTASIMPEEAVQDVSWSVYPLTGDGTITEDGVFTATKIGVVVIEARAKIDGKVYAYKPISVTKPEPISISTLTVKLAKTLYTYDGTAKKPAVTVKDAEDNAIDTANYSVKYASGRKVPGTYTVTVTMKGDYTGTKTLTFSIRGKQMAISKVSALSKGFKATWKKQSYVTGYQLQYSTSSKFTTKTTKTVKLTKNTTVSKSVTKLTAAKKYYVRIRSYKTTKISGKTYTVYSVWSKAKTVTTKK